MDLPGPQEQDLTYVVSPFTITASNLYNPLGSDIQVLVNAIHFSKHSCVDNTGY